MVAIVKVANVKNIKIVFLVVGSWWFGHNAKKYANITNIPPI
jgi:hypothetical protein